ncbi:DUF1269 domain-containing protein [Undibacterium sp. TS12]|uniref:DUF1269 domain-containing protein n=1 Tax=Undibacterium sp. TS12 TaxID=2908202 RepID=UPI001F4D2DA7|nr:DUF1269 domain-containing protein [Undibacterium sp. TS12]MCH8621833.1 DUF1269 domain-containing protein [Undibacterium sp. TS12]
MRRRLYFMLPDIPSARAMLDELLLARVEERYIHFMAKDNLPHDMPEASFFQKTDLVHGMELGMVVGAGAGLLAGTLLLVFPPEGLEMRTIALLVAAIGGAFFGSWVSGMAAAAIPNSRLKPFMQEIDSGKVLLIVDVPLGKVKQIEELIATRHPAYRYGGVEPHIPAFP